MKHERWWRHAKTERLPSSKEKEVPPEEPHRRLERLLTEMAPVLREHADELAERSARFDACQETVTRAQAALYALASSDPDASKQEEELRQKLRRAQEALENALQQRDEASRALRNCAERLVAKVRKYLKFWEEARIGPTPDPKSYGT